MLRHHFIERDDIETKYIIDIVKVVEMLCYQPLQPASIEMTRERERIYSMMCSTHKPCPLECNNDLLCMLGEREDL